MQRPPSSTLFPYTTLFRSGAADAGTDASDAGVPSSDAGADATTDAGSSRCGTEREYVTLDGNKAFYFASDTDRFAALDRKSTRLNSSHSSISYAVFCLKKK